MAIVFNNLSAGGGGSGKLYKHDIVLFFDVLDINGHAHYVHFSTHLYRPNNEQLDLFQALELLCYNGECIGYINYEAQDDWFKLVGTLYANVDYDNNSVYIDLKGVGMSMNDSDTYTSIRLDGNDAEEGIIANKGYEVNMQFTVNIDDYLIMEV